MYNTTEAVRSVLTTFIEINTTFTTRQLLTLIDEHYPDRTKGNVSSAVKSLLKLGVVEDMTPEKKRFKTYRYALPLHGYQAQPSAKREAVVCTVTINVKSFGELNKLIKKYNVINITGEIK